VSAERSLDRESHRALLEGLRERRQAVVEQLALHRKQLQRLNQPIKRFGGALRRWRTSYTSRGTCQHRSLGPIDRRRIDDYGGDDAGDQPPRAERIDKPRNPADGIYPSSKSPTPKARLSITYPAAEPPAVSDSGWPNRDSRKASSAVFDS